jgi:uncharacterized membrane protein YtjA (UPF0391 family)
MFLVWAAIFFLIAIVSAVFGFTDISADASHIAKSLFYISLAIFLILLLSGFLLLRKVKSFAHGLGFKDNWRGLLRRMK